MSLPDPSQPLPDLSKFSLKELYAIRQDAVRRINLLEDEAIDQGIIDEVNKKGFSCQPCLERDIPGLARLELPFLFYITLKEGKFEVEICEKPHYNQKEWVNALDFEYTVSVYDDYKQTSPWDYGDPKDPFEAEAMIKIPIYYRERDVPTTGEFKMIFENGDVRTGRLRGNEIRLFDDYDDDYYDCLSIVDNKLSRKAIILPK